MRIARDDTICTFFQRARQYKIIVTIWADGFGFGYSRRENCKRAQKVEQGLGLLGGFGILARNVTTRDYFAEFFE